MQLVEEGLNASKPGDTTAAAADLLTEMATLEQVWTLPQPLHPCISNLVHGGGNVLHQAITDAVLLPSMPSNSRHHEMLAPCYFTYLSCSS